jgi:hypothetical protein
MPYARELIEPIEVIIKIQAAKINELTNENNALKKTRLVLVRPSNITRSSLLLKTKCY